MKLEVEVEMYDWRARCGSSARRDSAPGAEGDLRLYGDVDIQYSVSIGIKKGLTMEPLELGTMLMFQFFA